MVVLSELGSESNPNNANVAKVKFTVRIAGQYLISVMIGTSHIAGSPFVRTFLPGPIEASKSRLVRPANTVVCCASAATLLYIEPRDEFGNGCAFKNDVDAIKVSAFLKRTWKRTRITVVSCLSCISQDFQVKVFDLNDTIDEKLSDAIVLSYDKVNMRISVTILFPEPICVKASITFKGRKIPNGDFDVIVLSSSDTTLVHKNISKRNICYEAKLLNVFSQPKSKPRKVICYIGPKQVSTRTTHLYKNLFLYSLLFYSL